MDQYHEEKFIESVIRQDEYFDTINFFTGTTLSTFVIGYKAGLRSALKMFAIQTGKPMKDNELLKDYYQRWLSMEYSQTDIPSKMKSLEEKATEPKPNDDYFQQWLDEHEVVK